MIGFIFLIVYVVVVIMLFAYGNVVHNKLRYEDVWYQIGDDEEECVFLSLVWPLALCFYFPIKIIYLLFFDILPHLKEGDS